jgi:hypothetical protein
LLLVPSPAAFAGGQLPDESQATRRQPPWQRPQTTDPPTLTVPRTGWLRPRTEIEEGSTSFHGRAGKAEHGEYEGDGRDEARAIFEHIGAQPWLDRLVALTV